MAKQVILLFGAPGAGKGTQSQLLSEKLGLYLFETSKILEKSIASAKPGAFVEVDGEKFYFEKEAELWRTGILCNPPFVVHFVMEKIKQLASEDQSIAFSGSPRTVYEAEKEIPLLEKLYGKENIKIILIDIKPEETIYRNTHRKICSLMRHSILFNKETENLTICPLDGSDLIKREGLDDAQTVKTRLKEYTERTYPIFDYFEKYGLAVNKINGEQTVAQVHGDILKVLDDKS